MEQSMKSGDEVRVAAGEFADKVALVREVTADERSIEVEIAYSSGRCLTFSVEQLKRLDANLADRIARKMY
jgi:transcription antitermination factor NusG